MIEYITKNTDTILRGITQHLTLSTLALLFSVLFGVMIGYFVYKRPRLGKLILSFFNTLKVIPSLALLLLMLPILKTGVVPSVVALVLIGIVPVILNTMDGLNLVDDHYLESGKGMGLSDSQLLWQVHVPLALPTIFTGIASAFVQIIASATLATYIGGGGLGNIIFTGLNLNRQEMLLTGGLLVALLSMLGGLLITLIQYILIGRKLK